jgi:hypothetical protein
METSRGVPPKSVVRALSKPGGQNVAKATGALLNWSAAGTDRAVGRASAALMRTAIRVLKTALPDTDPELIGAFLANLLDLWETGQKLEKKLQKLKNLRFPRDQEVLRTVLLWIDAIQVDMASYWIAEVKRDLPKLLRALDKLECTTVPRKQRRRPDARSKRS